MSNDTIPKLNEIDKTICENEISTLEYGKALKALPNNKSPGSDGFTTNFYKFFWTDIKEMLVESFNYSFTHGDLSQNQSKGILNLIPKSDKDLRLLSYWRPVSLLNTDYKILTKSIAMKLQEVIKNIVSTDQVGYIKDRYIGTNIRTIFDIMTLTELTDKEAYIALIDFEKAFDSIEWPFLFKTLKAFNFGENFIKWIQIIHTNISSCVGNNGTYSDFFELTRSIRQGCPLSALLFLLVAEIIAINLRSDNNIKGIKINDIEFLINLMADDTTLFLSDLNSLKIAINKFNKFRNCSGLKLNLTKTILIPIGNVKENNISTIQSLLDNTVKFLNVKDSIYTKHSLNIKKDRHKHTNKKYNNNNKSNRQNKKKRGYCNKQDNQYFYQWMHRSLFQILIMNFI